MSHGLLPGAVTVTVTREVPDKYGNPGAASTHTIDQTIPAPIASTPTGSRRGGWTVTTLDLYLPPGADLQEGDLVDVYGGRYKVVGQVIPWVNPFDGTSEGPQARLELIG